MNYGFMFCSCVSGRLLLCVQVCSCVQVGVLRLCLSLLLLVCIVVCIIFCVSCGDFIFCGDSLNIMCCVLVNVWFMFVESGQLLGCSRWKEFSRQIWLLLGLVIFYNSGIGVVVFVVGFVVGVVVWVCVGMLNDRLVVISNGNR